MANVGNFDIMSLPATRNNGRRMIRAAVLFAALLIGSSAHAATAGGWVCIAKSSYGTHAPTTTWSDAASSRQGAEGSAIGKCVAQAVNKRDCRVQRCWIGG
jgi:hypothetical protein